MDEKQLQFLFENYAKGKGFSNFGEFKDLMNIPDNRKLFFDDSNKELGFKDYTEFEEVLGVKKKGDLPSVGKQDGSTSNLGGGQTQHKPPKISFDPNKVRDYEQTLQGIVDIPSQNAIEVQKRQGAMATPIAAGFMGAGASGAGLSTVGMQQKASPKQELLPEFQQKKSELQKKKEQYEKEFSPLIDGAIAANKGKFNKDGEIDYKAIYSQAENMSKNIGGGSFMKEIFAQKMIEAERVNIIMPKVETIANDLWKKKTGKTMQESFAAMKPKEQVQSELLSEAASQQSYVEKEFALKQKEAQEKVEQESKVLWDEYYAPQFDLITEQWDFDETVAKYRADLKNIVDRENSRLKRIGNELKRQANQKLEAAAKKYEMTPQQIAEIQSVYDDAYNEAIKKDYEEKATKQRDIGVGVMNPLVQQGFKSFVLLGKSFAEGFNTFLASAGAGMVGLGTNNGLTDWLRSRQKQVDRLQTIDLELSGTNLLRPETYATRLGKQLGMQALPIAMTFATRNPYFGGTIGFATETLQNAGDTYNQVLEETGDPAQAQKSAETITIKSLNDIGLYFIDASLWLKASKGFGHFVKSTALDLPVQNIQELRQGYMQFQETEKGKGATFGKYFDEQGMETIKETTLITILQQGAFAGIGEAYNAIGKSNKNVGEQYVLDVVRKSGLAAAGTVAEQLALNGNITDEQLVELKERMAAVDADIQAMRTAGVSEKKIQGYIGNLAAIDDLKKQEAELAADSPMRQTLVEKRMKLEKEAKDLTSGGGTTVTVVMPNGTEIAVPATNIDATIENLSPQIEEGKVAIVAEGEGAAAVTEKVEQAKAARRTTKLTTQETKPSRRTTKLKTKEEAATAPETQKQTYSGIVISEMNNDELIDYYMGEQNSEQTNLKAADAMREEMQKRGIKWNDKKGKYEAPQVETPAAPATNAATQEAAAPDTKTEQAAKPTAAPATKTEVSKQAAARPELESVEATAKALEGVDEKDIEKLESKLNIFFHGTASKFKQWVANKVRTGAIAVENAIFFAKEKERAKGFGVLAEQGVASNLFSLAKDFERINLNNYQDYIDSTTKLSKNANRFINGYLADLGINEKVETIGDVAKLYSEYKLANGSKSNIKSIVIKKDAKVKIIDNVETWRDILKSKGNLSKDQLLSKYLKYDVVIFNNIGDYGGKGISKGTNAVILNIDAIQDVDNTNKAISEAYHKAKADGSNPELVAAVEELLGGKKAAAAPQETSKELLGDDSLQEVSGLPLGYGKVGISKDSSGDYYAFYEVFVDRGRYTETTSGNLGGPYDTYEEARKDGEWLMIRKYKNQQQAESESPVKAISAPQETSKKTQDARKETVAKVGEPAQPTTKADAANTAPLKDVESTKKAIDEFGDKDAIANLANMVYPDAGFHRGVLGGKSDYLQLGYSGDMPFTGYYFVSNPRDVVEGGSRRVTENDEKSFRIVDFSKYNLFKPTTEEYWAVKKGLKKVVDLLADGLSLRTEFNDASSYSAIGMLKAWSPSISEQILNKSKEIQKEYDKWREIKLTEEGKERFETIILKTLGYEGVDVRGLKPQRGTASPDSFSEGSVIFDLKDGTATSLAEAYHDALKKGDKKIFVKEFELVLGGIKKKIDIETVNVHFDAIINQLRRSNKIRLFDCD